MFTEAKVLLSINLQGGTLIREGKVTEGAVTILKSNKAKLHHKPTEKMVEQNREDPQSSTKKSAIKSVNLGREAYEYMTSPESYEPWMRKVKVDEKVYKRKLSSEERLKLHLSRLSEHYRGVSFTYQILS